MPSNAKSGFQFKQFFVAHDQCAMKVGTDSILLGSWCQPEAVQRVLDIGTGSGLLALMLAQKTDENCRITAIEIDELAYQQARENVSSSHWAHRVSVKHVELQEFHAPQKFDLIISNPPYYPVRQYHKNDTTQIRHTKARNLAREQDGLSLDTLISKAASLLGDDGRLVFILPADADDAVMSLLDEFGLWLEKGLEVSTVEGKSASRRVYQVMKHSSSTSKTNISSIAIRNKNGGITESYRELTKDFYLKG